MRPVLSWCLILGGAAAGGVFPGAAMAFSLAAASGLSGVEGEAFSFAANIAFGVGGGLSGALFADSFRLDPRRRCGFLFPAVLGVVAGVAGYLWLGWVLSHADPPL